jgi:hypothetical protein
MRRRSLFLLTAILAALLVPLVLPGAALAHERREVGGTYQFVVGFLTEPAFANQMNGLDLRVTIPSENNKPVEGLEQTLKATVIVGGGASTMPVELKTRFGQPGAYAGHFMPTRAGSYIFHITGTIDGAPIDERFESGPGRFNNVESLQALQFPEKLLDPVAASNDLKAARDEAATARTMGMVGVGTGVAGLLVGLVALVSSRRRGLAT